MTEPRFPSPDDPVLADSEGQITVGMISDVHGNLPALEAVLADMPSTDVIACLGDVIGYGPHPKECLDLVRKHAAVVIQGNHETTVAEPARYSANRMAHRGLQVAKDQLTEEDLASVACLPHARFLTASTLLCHGHPNPTRRWKYLFPHTLDTAVDVIESYDLDLLAFGHSHEQMVGEVADVVESAPSCTFLNPGSVGQPRDGDPRAAYAVVELHRGAVDVELRRVEYDIDRVSEEIVRADLPRSAADRLYEGT